MKYFILFLFLCLQINLIAQIKGNKKIVTQTYSIENLSSLEMNLYAEVIIDCNAKESMSITADENLQSLIDTEIVNGHMMLTQKDWIASSQNIIIRIGAPNLKRIESSVHETIWVKNLNRERFQARALIGKIILEGKVTELSLGGENGQIDAVNVDAPYVNVNLWSHGKIELGSPERIEGMVKEDGRIYYNSTTSKVRVKTKSGGIVYNKAEPVKNDQFDTRFIKLKVKNNSFNRINCYVKGPKPDGSYFSYGFPLNPGQVRKKNWTIGSKIYRVTKLGFRKLMAEVVADNEGSVLKLYQ